MADDPTKLRALWAMLETLEARAGMPLLRRDGDALEPTPEGARLLLDMERALDALAGERESPVGTLRVSAPSSFGRRYVAPVLARLAEEHPRLSLALSLGDASVDLARDAVDVMLRLGAPAESAPYARKLADNRRVLVASPEYLDRAGRPVSPDELATHALLRRAGGSAPWRLRSSAGKNALVATPARLTANSADVLHDWALAGHGILFASALDLAADLGAGRLEHVLPRWHGGPAPLVAVFRSAEPLPLKVRLFLEALESELEQAIARAG